MKTSASHDSKSKAEKIKHYRTLTGVSCKQAKKDCARLEELYGLGWYDKLMNFMFGGKKKNKLRDGEIHLPLITKNGIEMAEFAGPGSKTYDRAFEQKTKGEQFHGLTPSDTESMLHDVLYGLSKTEDDIRNADKHYIDYLNKNPHHDNVWNRNVTKLGIAGKVKLQDVFGLPTSKFTTYGEALNNPEMKKLYEEVRDDLLNRGYGFEEEEKKYPNQLPLQNVSENQRKTF